MTLLAYHEAPTKCSCITDRIEFDRERVKEKPDYPAKNRYGCKEENQHINGGQILFTYSNIIGCVYKYKIFKNKQRFIVLPTYQGTTTFTLL